MPLQHPKRTIHRLLQQKLVQIHISTIHRSLNIFSLYLYFHQPSHSLKMVSFIKNNEIILLLASIICHSKVTIFNIKTCLKMMISQQFINAWCFYSSGHYVSQSSALWALRLTVPIYILLTLLLLNSEDTTKCYVLPSPWSHMLAIYCFSPYSGSFI